MLALEASATVDTISLPLYHLPLESAGQHRLPVSPALQPTQVFQYHYLQVHIKVFPRTIYLTNLGDQ
jgi:hypothetical protein